MLKRFFTDKVSIFYATSCQRCENGPTDSIIDKISCQRCENGPTDTASFIKILVKDVKSESAAPATQSSSYVMYHIIIIIIIIAYEIIDGYSSGYRSYIQCHQGNLYFEVHCGFIRPHYNDTNKDFLSTVYYYQPYHLFLSPIRTI